MPDLGRRGGCRGCYGGMAWGGCYGGYGGCYGGGWGGCYGGGWGGCYGGYAMGWGGWGGGYGRGYVLGGASPWMGGYAYAPMMSGYGTPLVLGNTPLANVGMTQSFFFNPINATRANEATIVVHLPAEATLTIDGQPTQSTSSTRTFISPPLEPGKTYSYTLRAEMNRDGRAQSVKKTIDVRPGQPTEVTLDFRDADREENQINARPPAEQSTAPRRTPPPDR
jgi:uncharacterized protein (TIGR03000 family)